MLLANFTAISREFCVSPLVQPLLTHTLPHTLSAIKVNLLQHFKLYTRVKPVM